MKEKDIVTDILERVEAAVRQYLAHAPGFEESVIDEISKQIRAQDTPVRQDWGRTEPYVARRPPANAEAQARALEEARRTGDVRAAGDKNGISRATMYRLLSRRR